MREMEKNTPSQPQKARPVIVMIGDYPYETNSNDAHKVVEMARKAAEYFLSKGFPKEQVDRLYTTKVVDNLDQK